MATAIKQITVDITCPVLAVSIGDAAKVTSMSKAMIRYYIKTGLIKATRVGRRWIVPITALQAFVQSGVSCGKE